MEKFLYNLTNPQKSIWLTEQFCKGTSIGNISGTLLLKQKVNFNLLEKALNMFIEKNDAARIKILLENGVPKQYIESYSHFNINLVEVKDNDELKKLEERIISTPFNLLDSFLFEFTMIKFPDGTGGYNAKLHHIISDAWSMKLVIDKIIDIYSKLISDENSFVIPEYSYVEYINREQEYLKSNIFMKDKEYWERIFEHLPQNSSLKKQSSSSYTFDRREFTFDDSLISKINNFCSGNKISQFIFFLSVYSIYFRNILNSKDYIIGNPTLNRSNYYEKNTLGLFVCTQPFVINIDDNNTFIENCLKLSSDQKNIYRHLKYPFSSILEYIRKTHGNSERLFDIIFSYQNARADVKNSNMSFSSSWVPNKNQIESLMIHIKDTDNTNTLFVDYDYLIDVFSEDDILKLHERILNIIDQVLNDNSLTINNIDIVSNEEKNYLLNYLNKTDMEYDKNLTITHMFQEQVEKNPKNIAVTSGNTDLSYEELNNRANIIANELQKLNIKTGDIVGLMLNRNENIIVVILGILKLGAAYMPIDPDYPQDRISFMLKNSNTSALVTTRELGININYTNSILYIDTLDFNNYEAVGNPTIDFSSDCLSYIMYTSGSTGNPKAVSIQHYNVINFVKSMQKRLNYIPSEDNIVLSVTTMCFDIFVFEVFPTLLLRTSFSNSKRA